MPRHVLAVLLLALAVFGSVPAARAQVDARLLQFPDVSQTHIVFSYAGDLWVVPKEGGTAAKLSSPPGQEMFPRFSPDGKRIAYTANYDGNLDVYVVPAMGGVPTRVTYHGMADRLIDWYPQGDALLFASSMNSGRQRFSQFYRVSPAGGLPEQLPVPYGEFGALSSDGRMLAYAPQSVAFRTWKRYRGGWAPDVWIFDLTAKTAENVTKDPANDEFPMWHGRKLYFLSDRGEAQRGNLWSLDLDSRETKQVTRFTDFDIHAPSIGPSDIVFEAGGRLYVMSLADDTYKEVAVTAVTDASTIMPRTTDVSDDIHRIALAPDGKRVLVEARGDVFSVPAEHGPVLNLTATPGFAERNPAWSPDGKTAAWWSDASGEYELILREPDRPGSGKTVTKYGPGFRYRIYWSPDSRKLAFVDQTMRIRVYDRDANKTTEVDHGRYLFEGELDGFRVSWSPDSRWIAYRRDLPSQSGAICLYDTKEGKVHQVTAGYYNDREPVFDPDGKYLYFLTNRTFEPIYSDLDNSWIYANTARIAAASLTEDVPSPLAPRNDSTMVDSGDDEDTGDKDGDKDKDKDKDKGKDDASKTPATRITPEGLESRVVLLPPPAGNFIRLRAVSGKVVFHRGQATGGPDEEQPVAYYDLEEREEKTIIDDSDVFEVSADGKKALLGKDGAFAVVDVAEEQTLEKKLPTGDLESVIDPRAEWKQILNDVWRFERDYFYDPGLHGVDWAGLRTRYGALLEGAMTRWDVNFLIGELIAELNSSHTYRGGGDLETERKTPVGYLGVDWELAQGAYRIRHIVRGAPWDTEVRSPLAMPGVKVKEGDWVLAVNGRPIDPAKAPWAAFAGLAKSTVSLTVNGSPSLEGAHDVLVETMDDETRLRHLAWIESNRRRVDEATGGKIGYVYVPSTGQDGQTELVRQFAAQFDKQGLVIDERWNSGGQIPDRFIELLNRKPLAYWAVRDGMDWQWPPVANFGPKVMLINGWSGSGGDAFPDYFRRAGLGPLVGMRTWGGLIGISGNPDLIDGGDVTVPTFRMYTPDGKWFAEGHGVDPDIEVPEDPAQLAKGVDTQLERAIQEVMKLLAASPGRPARPAYERR